MQKYVESKNYTANYVDTLEGSENKQLKVLQSALRVTYVSPKAMHWITLVLKNLLNENKKETDIIQLLENYCRERVRNSDYKAKSGFQIEHIVFNYLDYLLYRDGYEEEQKQVIAKLSNWEFQFRNSIEHFYPQHPLNGDVWDEQGELNSIGNLALISTSGNSLFSNRIPEEKAKVDHIINQSLKLEIMAYITKKSG
nr:HNH endonuclease family protein [Macrococcus goetzii]